MAIENQNTPRKEIGRAVDYLSPSTQVQVGGGPQSFSVSASKSVAVPTPYVGRAAENTELLQLAKSLGMFNKQINALSYVVSNKAEEQAKQQGKEDALANTELAREIFKKTLDQSAKEGLFPRNAHPDYRMAYIETGAKALTIQGLTEYLDGNTTDLTSPDSMEPIGSTMRNRANQWIFDNIQDPRARAVAMESAFPIVQQYEQLRRGEREANFIVANEQAIGQLGMGLVEVAAQNSLDPEDTVQKVNRLDAMQNIQKLADTMVRNHPEFGGKQSIMLADMVTTSLQSQVREGRLDPRQAIKVVEEFSKGIKWGTGAWGDIPDVASKLNGTIVYFENQARERDLMGKSRQTAQFDVMKSRTQNLFRELDVSGELATMDEGQLASKISSLASELGIDELADSPFTFLDEERNDFFERKQKFNTLFAESVMPSLEEEMRVSPESALETLKSFRGQMPTAEYESALEKITQRMSVINDLKIGRFDDKLRDIEKNASNLLAAQDPMQTIAFSSAGGIKQDEVVRVAELQDFGENEFRMLATDNVEQRIQAEPSIKDPERQTEYTAVVNEAVGAAYTETLKRMEERKKQMDAEKEANGGTLDESETVKTYGKSARMVSEVNDAINAVSSLDPRGETTAETAEFKLTLDRAKRQLPDLARQIKLSSGDQRTQLEATYTELRKITGLGVDTVLNGKTEDGIVMDLKEIQKKEKWWDTITIFKNEEELVSVLDEDIQSGKQGGGGGGNLVDFVVREEAGADGSSFYPTPKWDYKQWTIGYGTKARGKNDRVTPQEAKQRLVDELDEKAIEVDTALDKVGIILDENQRNALISFNFNTGAGLKVILDSKGDIDYIRNKMMEYIKVTPDPSRPLVKVEAAGLVARRKRELDLFNGVTQPTTVSITKLDQLIEKLGIPMESNLVKEFIDAQKLLIKQRTFSTPF
jgi:GH24 family phage-related lysozyme (muramidase)